MVLEAIKERASEIHHRLEQSGLLKPITSTALTLEHSLKVLHTFYGYYHPLEKEGLDIMQMGGNIPQLLDMSPEQGLNQPLSAFIGSEQTDQLSIPVLEKY